MKRINQIFPKAQICPTSFLKTTNSLKKTVLFVIFSLFLSSMIAQPIATGNYNFQTGTLGTTYSWVDCSAGTSIISGDDMQASINWPFSFTFYGNTYTTANSLSVATNGFIRLDGVANGGNYTASRSYDLTASATNFGQIISLAMYDSYVGRIPASSWVKYIVTGSAPNQVLTIEYQNLEIPYYMGLYADIQVSFYETTNKVVIKLGDDNITTSGVDIGIHSGVANYFNKWQEVASGTNNTWIEYTLPIKVTSTSGTALAYYPTLKSAFDKINSGAHQGDIDIQIQESTIESASAALNATGTGSAMYNNVSIYPTKSGITVTGNIAAPLINLNGADNVTIDGRVNKTGSDIDLSIINTSTSNTAGTSAIRLINDATQNTIQYCNIKGSQTLASSGIIFFSTGGTGVGNDNNVISNNNITSSTNANRPVNAIFSLGTAGKENSDNEISDNNIYDFFKHATASNGIFISSNSTSWNISGNSFYETTTFIPTATVTYNAIQINNVSGNDFTVSGNYIGGSSSQCNGTAWTKTNAANNVFNAILLSVGTTSSSSIQNNTIKNISWSNSGNAAWSGINVTAGNVNIGTETGNTIGATTGTGSITITGGTSGQTIYGINIASTGTIDCQKNAIGSITSVNGATLASHIYGIYKTATTGTITISNNTIGSTSTANSINASSASTANAQYVYGIYNAGTGTVTISGNTISKLTNGTTNTTAATIGLINGITSVNGTNTISNNTIYDLTIANANTNAVYQASVCGISLNGTTTNRNVTGNTIYNLSNTYNSFAGSVMGIHYTSIAGSSNTIQSNFIHSLSAPGGTLYGIKISSGASTFSNNIINLGGTNPNLIYGIFDVAGASQNNSIYFNTIYIGGTLNSSSSNSYALYINSNQSTRNYRNNIFSNARSNSGGTGKHYAIYYAGTGGTFSVDYNDYHVSGTGGTLGYYGGDRIDLATLKTATGQDTNSLNTNPGFSSAGGTEVIDYYISASLTGVFGTGITVEFFGITRNDPPVMGALESNDYVWQGNTSSDFGTASNWLSNQVPLDGASISFASNPANHCVLDQNRVIKNITNTQSAKQLNINGKQLTLTGDLIFSNGAQIDASNSASIMNFEGTAAQNIPSGSFTSNTIGGLTLNNSNGLTLNGNATIVTELKLTIGTFSIGANTLTINGAITKTGGTMTGGASTNIVFGGSGASTELPAIALNDLTINRANGISLSGSVSVAGTLALTSGTLTVGANTLTISGNTPTRTSGNLDASNSGATLIFNNSTSITLPTSFFAGAIQNLTINGTGGITSTENMTVNGIMDLASTNPSSTKGTLDMSSSSELTMGLDGTNIGIGDVTGIIARYSFVENHTFTFGNPNSSATFNPGATTLPTFLKLRVVIGAAPAWRTGAINRVYDLIQSGGDNSIGSFRCHYLDSELNGNTEDQLSLWTPWDNVGNPPNLDNGKSNYSVTNNWVELSDVMIMYFPPAFGMFPITLDETELSYSRWTGLVSTDWNNAANWSPMSVPTPSSYVKIPDATTTPNDPTLPANANTQIMSLLLETGFILNSGNSDNAQLSLTHNLGTWSNNGGTFNPGNSTVNFIRYGNTTISGTTSFYNLHLADTVILTLNGGTYIKIGGALTIGETGALRGVLRTVVSGSTTVEYNGGNQTVVIPNTSTNRYSKLVLSGTGVKTMPSTNMHIYKDLFVLGTTSVTAASSLTVDGELNIAIGATFNTGNYSHSLKGHFDNSGTFNATAGTSLTLNGDTSQKIYGATATTFEKLTIDNSQGVTIYTNATLNNTLELTNGHLNIGSTLLTVNENITRTFGYLGTTDQSSITFNGSVSITLSSSFFETEPTLNNLTINRTGGVAFGCNLTLNGILNLQSSNPSATVGSLDMGTNTLTMNGNATTIGIGDVTGYVKRTTFLPEVEYTFGNPYTSIFFPNIGTLPSEMTLKITIGTAPSWKADAVKRVYDLKQTGGSGTQAVINGHYLDSELNGNDENNLFDLTYIIPTSTLTERGRSNFNTTENWVSLSNANVGNLPTTFGVMELGFGVPASNILTWNGSTSTSWTETTNWTPNSTPSATSIIIIPDATTTNNDPTLPASSTISTLAIRSGAILNSSASASLTLNGSSGAWSNQGGTFNASTSTISITNAAATINGTTDFFNLTIETGATLSPTTGTITRIANVLTNNGTLNARNFNNTIEYNGSDQTIILPNGTLPGYHNLTLSGSGTKTLPSSTMIIDGNFSTSGSTSGTASGTLTILENVSIGNGSTFATGNYDHVISGNFENNGTFTSYTGKSLTFNGTSAQTISGSATTSFDILTIDNPNGVTQSSPVDITNNLALINGTLSIGTTTLGINGTITRSSGNITVTSNSSLSFGGTSAITLNNNLFSSTPSINNLTINRSGGVTLGNQDLIVNGGLTLTSGTLTIASNTLTIAGSSPSRTSGNVDASDANATIAFANTVAITLPDSFFIASINNFTISGNGGVTAGSDMTILGILNLSAANPSSTKGSLEMGETYILDMGVSATTTGTGDATGIIRRQHTFSDGVEYSFGNQFTSVNFLNTGTKPTWVKCKISIGIAPTWRGAAIKRYYSFAQSGGTDRIIAKLHYLDSELHDAETDESKLIFWDAYDPAFAQNNFVNFYPRNKNNNNSSDNWVQLTGPAINYIATSSNLDVKQWGLGYTNVTKHVWTGNGSPAYDGDWSLPGNWSGGVPTANDDVLIPRPADLPADNNGDYPFVNNLSSIVSAEAKSIEIEAGANINGNNYNITIYGDSTAWINNGTFTPGNGTITFANGDITKNVYLSGNTQFNNLTINDKTNIIPSTGTTNSIKGDFICNGNYISTNNNTFIVNGSTGDQMISGNGNIQFYNFTMNNTFSSGKLTLDAPISISKTLTLTNNHIHSDTIHYLELTNTADVSPAGGSSSSYIDGSVRKIGNTSFIFPVGNSSQYAPISISDADGGGSATDYFTAYYQNNTPSVAYDSTSLDDTLYRVSAMEYWMLNRTGTNDVSVTLSWNARSGGVTNLADLRIAHWNGTTWTNAGNAATTGDTSSGTITSNLLTSFSPFTLASVKKGSNPLPITLVSFDAKLSNGETQITWITASEVNNDYFTVERTADGITFEPIATIDGAGNSNQKLSYGTIDKNPLSGTSYYRLKQTDYDGSYKYSNLVAINNYSDEASEIALYPNPNQGKFTIASNSEYTNIQICNVFGSIMMEQKPTSLKTIIDATNLPNGIYFVKIISGDKSATEKMTINR